MSDEIDRKAEAHRVRNRRYYRRHRKKVLDRQRANYCPNYASLYYQANRDELLAKVKAYQARKKAEDAEAQ